MSKICFFDIDGTIIGRSRVITEKNLEAIRCLREKGHKAILCTGRSPASIPSSIREIGWDGIVSSAGSYIYVDDQLIFENHIDSNKLLEIIYLFTKNHILFGLETKEWIYQSPGIKDFFDEMFKRDSQPNLEAVRAKEDREFNASRKPLTDFNGVTPVAKVTFIAHDKESFERIIPYVENDFNIVYFSQPHEPFMNGELILKTCTKGDGVRRIVEFLGASMEDTIAFGDSMNDHEMLLVANKSYVSELSSEYLKSIADGEFEDPDKNGMAHLLRKLELI